MVHQHTNQTGMPFFLLAAKGNHVRLPITEIVDGVPQVKPKLLIHGSSVQWHAHTMGGYEGAVLAGYGAGIGFPGYWGAGGSVGTE